MSRSDVIVVILVLVWILLPFGWQFATSLKSPDEISQIPPKFLPSRIYLENYLNVFAGKPPFGVYLRNSLIVAGGASILSLFLASLAGFALARIDLKGRGLILCLILLVSMFPQISIVSPLFLAMRRLGILNTYLALILPYTSFTLPLAVWLLTNFFKEIPDELVEAARIDGCSPMTIFVKIIFPLAAPGVFTAGILCFIFAWNEFLFALIFNTKAAMRTVTVGMAMFPGLYETPWGTIFAAATIVTLPLIIVVLILQRRIISGLTAGAIKG